MPEQRDRDEAASVMLRALKWIVETEPGLHWRTDEQARRAIAQAEAAGIRATSTDRA